MRPSATPVVRAWNGSSGPRPSGVGDGRHATGAADVLSACLIVKDEEQDLPACLAALSGLVDETVVYDTGSTDGTVDVALRAGARVVRGYWDDDFARARNAALDACTGTWVLTVDADEVAQGDVAVVRQELRTTTADALIVRIANLGDDGRPATWHSSPRLFRRGRARWSGALHEQVVAADGRALRCRPSSLELRHSGYTSTALEHRDKAARNLHVAQRALAVMGDTDVHALINLGRSLHLSGRGSEALEHLDRAGELAVTAGYRRLALRAAVELLVETGRPGEALERLDRLRAVTGTTSLPDYLEGLARLGLHQPEQALACFDRIDVSGCLDDEALAVPRHLVARHRGLALLASQRWREAAAVLLPAQQATPSPTLWVPLLESHHHGRLSLDAVVALDDSPRRVQLLGQALNADTETANALALHLWASDLDRLVVLAFVAALAERLALPQAVDWSVRAREHGLAEHCPLVPWAADHRLAVLPRLQATAVLSAAADPRADQLLPQLADELDDSQIIPALLVLDELSPTLLPAFVRHLAEDSRRRAATADALDALGAAEQAAALRATAA